MNNLGLAFKTYLTIINNWIWKSKKLKEDKTLFKAIKEEETWIITEQKTSANFTTIRSNYLWLQEKSKKKQIEWPLYKKCVCKHFLNQICRHTEDKYYKYHVKRHISWFYNLYIILNTGLKEIDKLALFLEIPKINYIYPGVIY